jgi:hypothetical protein
MSEDFTKSPLVIPFDARPGDLFPLEGLHTSTRYIDTVEFDGQFLTIHWLSQYSINLARYCVSRYDTYKANAADKEIMRSMWQIAQ